jgi:hypothetical protein
LECEVKRYRRFMSSYSSWLNKSKNVFFQQMFCIFFFLPALYFHVSPNESLTIGRNTIQETKKSKYQRRELPTNTHSIKSSTFSSWPSFSCTQPHSCLSCLALNSFTRLPLSERWKSLYKHWTTSPYHST